jgi:rubredoxin
MTVLFWELTSPMPKQSLQRINQSPLLSIKRPGITDIEMKKGDWLCPRCKIIIFARNTTCIQCYEKRPKRPLNPGEWDCPVCNFINSYRTDDAIDNFQHSKQLEQKLKNPVKTDKPFECLE